MSTAVLARPKARKPAAVQRAAILAHAPRSWKARLGRSVVNGVLLLCFAYAACGQHLLYVLS